MQVRVLTGDDSGTTGSILSFDGDKAIVRTNDNRIQLYDRANLGKLPDSDSEGECDSSDDEPKNPKYEPSQKKNYKNRIRPNEFPSTSTGNFRFF